MAIPCLFPFLPCLFLFFTFTRTSTFIAAKRAPWPAQKPGLETSIKSIQFLSSSSGREGAALVYPHRPANWDAMDWVRCVCSLPKRRRSSTSVRDEKWRERTRTDDPRLERQSKRSGVGGKLLCRSFRITCLFVVSIHAERNGNGDGRLSCLHERVVRCR